MGAGKDGNLKLNCSAAVPAKVLQQLRGTGHPIEVKLRPVELAAPLMIFYKKSHQKFTQILVLLPDAGSFKTRKVATSDLKTGSRPAIVRHRLRDDDLSRNFVAADQPCCGSAPFTKSSKFMNNKIPGILK